MTARQIFGALAFAAASALIVLRMCVFFLYFHGAGFLPQRERSYAWRLYRIAIWDRNRIAVAIAMCAWSTNVAFLIHCKLTPSLVQSIVQLHGPGLFV
jgi:hypothetical protein